MGPVDVHCPLSLALPAERASDSSWNLVSSLSLASTSFAPVWSPWMDLVHLLPGTVKGPCYQHLAHPAMTRPCGTMCPHARDNPASSGVTFLLLQHWVWGNSRPLLLPGRGSGETTLTPSTLKNLQTLASSAICPSKKWGWKDFAARLIIKDT